MKRTSNEGMTISCLLTVSGKQGKVALTEINRAGRRLNSGVFCGQLVDASQDNGNPNLPE
jgi:hypothetical protein